MAEAIVARLIAVQTFQPSQILVSDPSPQRRDYLSQTYGIEVTPDNPRVFDSSPILVLAIKPQVLAEVATEWQAARVSAPPELVISILAGTTLSKLEAVFADTAVLRAMPNTPATIGAGITAIAPGQKVTPAQIQQATAIFQSVGDVVTVPEALMNAVTGLSGSGPAFVAIAIEALADGGVAAGLPRGIAAQLALATVWGTAQLLRESGLHPAQLKDQVTSPGGTTIAGITALEASGFRSALIQSVQTASDRARALGSQE